MAQAIALGGQPASDFHIPERPMENLIPPAVPPGVPGGLMARRPDLTEAERRLAAANLRAALFSKWSWTECKRSMPALQQMWHSRARWVVAGEIPRYGDDKVLRP